ncbi:Alpha-galactosidase Mel36A [subsurface metagenome]
MEYFIVDAGWFKGGFREGIGNWEIVDKDKFPEGMNTFARYVESKGMKFGSWLEIEYAMKNSDWARRHPDWYYSAKDREDLLLRVDDSSVRSKVLDFLERFVKENHIQWLRWDFNDDPAPFWEANEKENQKGWIQIQYAQGLLKLLDEFLRRCPGVHLEACAGGGHRMDLGTLRRAHSCWMNDNSTSSNAIRQFLWGLNHLLPGI